MKAQRTPPKKKAQQLAKHLRSERPDYNYLKKLFYYLRHELEVEVPNKPKKLPLVPSEAEIRRLYEAVFQSKRFGDMVIIKTFLYTGVRVSELANIRLDEVDFELCQIRINQGKGNKDRIVPFPASFKETLAMHHQSMLKKKAAYLFESSWKRKYSERGICKMLRRYTDVAGIKKAISPHKLRHFFLLWLKKQGLDDALIQPYSGHASRQSLEIYSRLAIAEAQQEYNNVIGRFPI
ncbi:MAG: tyrosine-type recombinase/integrase [Planctomycetota bacterium]|jgi:integrase/recombinase XerD